MKNKQMCYIFGYLKITKVRIRFCNYLLEADERMSCIQNLSAGYNLNSDNIFFGTHNNCQNLIVPIVMSCQPKKRVFR